MHKSSDCLSVSLHFVLLLHSNSLHLHQNLLSVSLDLVPVPLARGPPKIQVIDSEKRHFPVEKKVDESESLNRLLNGEMLKKWRSLVVGKWEMGFVDESSRKGLKKHSVEGVEDEREGTSDASDGKRRMDRRWRLLGMIGRETYDLQVASEC